VASRQEVLFIKNLISSEYKDKHICLVTKAKQPYVSKIRHGRLQAKTSLRPDEVLELTNEQKVRLNTLNKILSMPEIINAATNDDDLIYMHVLKFFLMNKEQVADLYFHLPKRIINQYWIKKDVDIRMFKSDLIGIPRREYLDLIIDYFLE